MRRFPLLAVPFLAVPLMAAAVALADGPKDNQTDNVRPVPPKGSPVPEEVRAELTAGLRNLRTAIDAATAATKGKPELADLLPDVEIYHKAIRYALDGDEMYIDPKSKRDDAAKAKALLQKGIDRATELKDGKPGWPTQKGPVVRGYVSKIDGSVQPYGIVVPDEYDAKTPARLDFWWHGRGELLTEVDFITGRIASRGEFTPKGALVVHPYGRYCNANKFAGEIDSLEILEHVKKHYKVDTNRLVARGFSMGGAACWQYAVHYPTLWCAAAPGAGFAETREFLNDFQGEQVKPTWYEKKLWRMYDCTEYAQNIFDLPTVAYSGEIDKQKQAADVMAREMKKVGLTLTHVIGEKAGHSYTPAGKKEVNEKIDAIVAKGLPTERPEIKFTTCTLRYNQCGWLTVERLQKHWEAGTVHGAFDGTAVELTTKGVDGLAISLPKPAKLTVDGQHLTDATDVPVQHLYRRDGKWAKVAGGPESAAISLKRHGLQGPIDDAFMDKFLMVRPTGTPMNEAIGAWTKTEMAHAVEHWRKQFRGDAPIKDDKDVTAEDIASSNLVLWGDPKSNAILAKVAGHLPLKEFGDSTVTACIYPNPLNPSKYVVLNSGFTFREYDYLNNARQVSKLPDYAVIDVTTPANSRTPGKVVRAGFFDEQWKLQKDDGEK